MRYLATSEPVHIVVALLLDFLLGDPDALYHPVRAIGFFISEADKRISGKKRTAASLRWWGLLLWVVTVTGSFLTVLGLLFVAARIHPLFYVMMNITLCWLGIAAGSLEKESGKVMLSLQKGNLPEARAHLAGIVGRDTDSLEKSGIIRAAVETVAENTSDGVIAPLFYAFLGGAPLLWAYKAVNTLDSMVGYKNEKYADLGFVSAKMDDFANYVPARITALLIIISALIPGFSHQESAKVWRRDRRNHKSPNSAHPEAAVAGALGIRLGGDALYAGKIVEKPYIGEDKRRPEAEDIRRAQTLMYSATGVFAAAAVLWFLLDLERR